MTAKFSRTCSCGREIVVGIQTKLTAAGKPQLFSGADDLMKSEQPICLSFLKESCLLLRYAVWEKVHDLDLRTTGSWMNPEEIPDYDTDIQAAWTIVERWRKQHPSGKVRIQSVSCGWFVSFETMWADAETLPEAICRAALKADWSTR